MFIKQSDDLLLLNDNSEKAKATLYEKYKPIIRGIFMNKIDNNYHTVEELTSEVLIKVFTKLDKYNKVVPFNCWVFSITRNHLIDYYKKKSSKKSKIEKEMLSINAFKNDYEDNHKNNSVHSNIFIEPKDNFAVNNIENYDFFTNIEKYLDTIEDKESVNIFKLRAIEGYNYDQIQVKVGINKNQIMKKYNLIRLRLQNHIISNKII